MAFEIISFVGSPWKIKADFGDHLYHIAIEIVKTFGSLPRLDIHPLISGKKLLSFHIFHEPVTIALNITVTIITFDVIVIIIIIVYWVNCVYIIT